jgi:hypothetical protein
MMPRCGASAHLARAKVALHKRSERAAAKTDLKRGATLHVLYYPSVV